MLKKKRVKRFNAIFLMVCCISMLSSCNDGVDEVVGSSLVTLNVTLPQDDMPEMESPVLRSGNLTGGVGDESKIESMKIFIFNKDNSAFEVYATSVNNSMWDDVAKTLRVTVTQGNKRIYCITNWTDGGDGMTTIANNQTIANLESAIRSHANSFTIGNPPVMTGYFEGSIVGNETDLTIPLKRQIARVELSFKLSDVLSVDTRADIKITGVKFMKLPSASFVFPKLSLANPGGVTLWNQMAFTGVTTGKLTGTKADYPTKYYIPENVPTAANATIMVVSATYNGDPTYYSIMIDPSKSPSNASHPHVPYAIERNHTYQYDITINGKGVATAPTRSGISEGINVSYKLEIK